MLSSELDFLNAADALFKQSADSPGGVIALRLDEWRALRAEQGYAGVFSLREQLAEICSGLLDDGGKLLFLRESLLVLLVPLGQDADEIGEQLHGLLSRHPFTLADEALALTFSQAWCRLDQRFGTADRALVAVLEALDGIPDEARNHRHELEVVISSRRATADDQQMLALLMESLRDDRVQTVFQPLLPTRNSQRRFRQMLPRLRADDGHLITAADFLPVAERAGLVATIDRWMIRRALELLLNRPEGRGVCLFLSQSSALLSDAKRRETLAGQLESVADLDGRLVLDFALADVLRHLKGAGELFELLAQHRVGICYSRLDIGSNLDLLGDTLPVDFLRMSPAYVNRLQGSEDIARELQALVGDLREKGARIILPMIEDPDAAAALWASGADFLQGNLIQAASESLNTDD
ncbi:MAG: EAL domain-containing protein [Wenzhouxiangella sp.]